MEPKEPHSTDLAQAGMDLFVEASHKRPNAFPMQAVTIVRYCREHSVSPYDLRTGILSDSKNITALTVEANKYHLKYAPEKKHITNEEDITKTVVVVFDLANEMMIFNDEELTWIYNNLFAKYSHLNKDSRQNKYREVVAGMIDRKQNLTGYEN